MLTRECKIGSGSFGKIYKAKNEEGEEFAVKICMKYDTYSFGMSYRETELGFLFDHPYIICLCASIDRDPFSNRSPCSPLKEEYNGLTLDTSHLVYELADTNLDDYGRHYKIPFLTLQGILAQVLLALEYMHASEYIHRDVRCDNILLFVEQGVITAKLADMGFMKHFIENEEKSLEFNNDAFKAPECLMGSRRYNYTVDTWSLGCVIYYLVQRDYLPLITDTNAGSEKYLSYLAERLPYSLPEEVRMRYKITTEGQSWEEFFPLTSTKKEQLEQCCSQDEFKELLLGMLTFDQDERWTASRCLDSPFFDKIREEITETRRQFPKLQEKKQVCRIIDCKERTWSKRFFQNLFSRRKNYPWYSERILFLGISLMDRVLVYLKKTENEEIVPTKTQGRMMNDRQTMISCSVCIYLALKYFASNESQKYSFESLYPKVRLSEEELEYAENFEKKVFFHVCSYKLYTKTVYDHLLSLRVPSKDDKKSLLRYVLLGHENGMSLEKSYAYWNKHRLYYLK